MNVVTWMGLVQKAQKTKPTFVISSGARNLLYLGREKQDPSLSLGMTGTKRDDRDQTG
jgi:hypothetical protein